MPVNPVPMVNAFGLAAVMVPEPPKETATPLYDTVLFNNCALVMVPLNAVVGMVVAADMMFVPLA